jgi:colicin import membrane protein
VTEVFQGKPHTRGPEPNRFGKLVFAVSLLLHGSLAVVLHARASDKSAKKLAPQTVDIEFAKRPPPPPPPPPPEPEIPPEPQPEEKPRVQPKPTP